MKKLLLLMLFVLIAGYGHSATEWKLGTGTQPLLGTTLINDIDTQSVYITDPLERLLSNYRQNGLLSYLSASTITVAAGEVTCSNSAATIRKMRQNTSSTTVTWANIDTGSEATSTTYYVYAVADADATTFTIKLSTSSSAPSGATYYKRLGSFYNNSSGDITLITNDNLVSGVTTSYGTIAHGGTISLPSGYDASQCSWIVSNNSTAAYPKYVGGITSWTEYTTSISSSRVVTCTGESGNNDGGSQGVYTGTANYLIICTK